MPIWILAIAGLLLSGLPARAHIGSPYIIFEGKAGLFPVRVVVRQPDVVPGLAEISVRVLEGSPSRVTALPLHTSTGREGAPRADIAQPVAGTTNLFSAALWFMTRGAYGVEVALDGPGGGTVTVPVNSVATVQKPLPRWLGGFLSAMGALLVIGVITIAAGAVRESTLPADAAPDPRRGWQAWLGGLIAALLAFGALWGGSRWWGAEELRHQTRVLFRQLAHTVSLANSPDATALTLELTDARFTQSAAASGSRSGRRSQDSYLALVPDHGKLIHLFLVGEPDGPSRSAFAHLHPVPSADGRAFTTALPPLPAGRYRLYADLTHEMGLTQTLTNTVTLPAPGRYLASDHDDAWSDSSGSPTNSDGIALSLDAGQPRVGEPAALRFTSRTADGQPARLQPYLRMLGHAVIERTDGSVFAHVHPAGTLSLAAARGFAERIGGDAAAQAADVNCGDLAAVPPAVAEALGRGGEVTFPFVFPRAGDYRVWVQVRVDGKIRTGAFAVTLPP